jgi:hypothetical protein
MNVPVLAEPCPSVLIAVGDSMEQKREASTEVLLHPLYFMFVTV